MILEYTHFFIGKVLHWFQQGFVRAGVVFDWEPPKTNRNSNYA